MPNKVVSQDIDTLLTKATKEEAATFLGIEDTKAVWGQITGTLSNQADLAAVTDNIATNATNISTNQTDIITQGVAISDNATNISANETAIAGKQDALTFGTANTNAVKIDNTSAAPGGGDIAIFASNGIMPKTFQSLKSDLGVDDKAPKASPTFTGSAVTPELIVGVSNGDQLQIDVDGSNIRFNGNDGTGGGVGNFLTAHVNGTPNDEVSLNAAFGTLTLSGNSGVHVGDDLHVASFGSGTDTTKVGIRTKTPSEALDVNGNIKVTGNVTLPTAGKTLTKQKCYSNGAVRLQRGNTDSEEILLRYEGPNSEDFVIQQWHGGNKEGQIKFQGDTPNGSNTVRLDAKNVDIGFTGTTLTKIYSDTNIVANKKVVFTDTRDATDGLQFNHTGAVELVQMGMYGSYGDSSVGEFKITHKDGTASNTDVLSILPTTGNVKIHKPLNLQGLPVCADETAANAAGLLEGDVYRTSTGELRIKLA